MRFVLVAGSTETARIDGISAAGAEPELMLHTPGADAEILAYGDVVRAPEVPVSPTGCPTPAVVTRAVRELLDFETLVVDAGIPRPTAAPTVSVGADPGRDLRDPPAVPDATALFESARELGRSLPEDRLVLAETIPGGTTTALGVLTALGERATVSSSLPENPIERKRSVVQAGLQGAGLDPGAAAGDPIAAVRAVGDPVLATVAGLVAGATDRGTEVVLAGGTQMAAAAALARHSGVGADLELATTAYVAADDSDLDSLAADLDLEVAVTDPGFDRLDHPATARFPAGEAKEGVGMGGALALADRAGIPTDAVRERTVELYERVVSDP